MQAALGAVGSQCGTGSCARAPFALQLISCFESVKIFPPTISSSSKDADLYVGAVLWQMGVKCLILQQGVKCPLLQHCSYCLICIFDGGINFINESSS